MLMRWWWCDDDDDEDDEDEEEEEEEEEEDRFVLDQHVELEFYGTSSFKQQSEGKYQHRQFYQDTDKLKI
jgi:hypothetical protein